MPTPNYGFAPRIELNERGTSNDVVIDPYHHTSIDVKILKWKVQLLRRGGLGACTFTLGVTNPSVWGLYEAFFQTNTKVSFRIRTPRSSAFRVWSGTIERIEDVEGFPRSMYIRKVRCASVGQQGKNPGCKILACYDDQTINYVAKQIMYQFAGESDASSWDGLVTAGTDYTVPRILFEDRDFLTCLRRLAEVNQHTIYGITSDGGIVYFQDEASLETGPTRYDLQIGEVQEALSGGGTVSRALLEADMGHLPNSYIVEGRDAPSGNPLTILVEDIADYDWVRRSRITAPELALGPDMLRWAQYKLAVNNANISKQKITCIGAPDDSAPPQAPNSVNGNLILRDHVGDEIGKWPIQAITMSSYGALGKMEFDVGGDIQTDLVSAFDIRDLLRDIETLKAHEFSNQVELAATDFDWHKEAYILFIRDNGMRNSWRASLHRLDALDLSSLDPDDESTVVVDSDKRGITSALVGGAEFLSKSISIGLEHRQWALRRHVVYPTYIAGHTDPMGAFYAPWNSTEEPVPPWWVYAADWQNTIMPLPNSHDGLGSYDGALLLKMPVSRVGDLIITFFWPTGWGNKQDGVNQVMRQYVFYWNDKHNYHFVRMYRPDGSAQMERDLYGVIGKVTDGLTTYASADPFHFVVDCAMPCERKKMELTISGDGVSSFTATMKRVEDGETQVRVCSGFASGLTADHTEVGMRFTADQIGGSSAGSYQGWFGRLVEWGTQRIDFDNCTGGNEWYISRDGVTWEGPLDPDTAATVNLGVNANDNAHFIIKGRIEHPQVCAGIAAGWKDRIDS